MHQIQNKSNNVFMMRKCHLHHLGPDLALQYLNYVCQLVYPGTLFGGNFWFSKADFPFSVAGYCIWKTPVVRKAKIYTYQRKMPQGHKKGQYVFNETYKRRE